ncbi:glycoprotein-N-acetylgalactosamine 3-beta-galactosyltransferase 1-like isoform X1 [Artemia franciscana]|uniref:glycoprotein-N-acetylgalactosamine 3-beta-galactosyltransferase 1-like isoform X1 n=1 Tax=Artemia franciscana TaxID=6661 RepID=UPI0032DA50CF
MIPYRWIVISRSRPLCSAVISLLVGVCIGLFVTISIVDTSKTNNFEKAKKSYHGAMARLAEKVHQLQQVQPFIDFPKGLKDSAENTPDNSVSEHLYENVRLLCWILTGAKNHQKKAIHVKATWGKRCNILLFVSSKEDSSLPTIAFRVPDTKTHLWGKTKEAFKFIYNNYSDKADWFFKADDDTFAIPENARYLLSRYNTSEPIYFGAKIKRSQSNSFASGGAGYILSKEALRRFATIALKNQSICDVKATEGKEDINIASCLNKVGVTLKDSRDEKGKERFLPFSPAFHTVPGTISDHWYYRNIYYKAHKGAECCSDTVISFHYVSPNEMYIYNYLLYQVRIHGTSPSIFPEHWTAPPPPDPEGKEPPWIGIRAERIKAKELEKKNTKKTSLMKDI